MRVKEFLILIIFWIKNIECQNSSVIVKHEADNPHRIIGGWPISIKEAPYQVAMLIDNYYACGGSIINRYWILTAAHCVRHTAGSRLTIVAGTRYFRHGGQERLVRTSIYNGSYNPKTKANDIAMLRLKKPLNFNEKVQAVKLASPKNKLPSTFYVTGWGVQKEGAFRVSKGLKQLNLKLVPHSKCYKRYKNLTPISKKMICAAKPKADACQGDSGGPLTHDGVQYGIVSFGYGCARARYPGVYLDVRTQRKWIKKVIRNY